jgi:hypothetical protein
MSKRELPQRRRGAEEGKNGRWDMKDGRSAQPYLLYPAAVL